MDKSLTFFSGVLGLTLLVACAVYAMPVVQSATSNTTPNTTPNATPNTTDAEAISRDRLTHPPKSQAVTAGSYRLTLQAADQWQPPTVTAALYDDNRLQWQQTLPHQYGPKFALVSPSGQTALFDEYINIASEYAIAIISPTSEITHTYSFDDIHQVLQQTNPTLTRAVLTQKATTGWWIAAAPTLNDTGTHALIPTGGTTLQVDLTTGELIPGESSPVN